jgi:hypothetical protein
MNDASNSRLHETIPKPPRRQIWLRWLLMCVIFVSGGIVGLGGTLIVLRKQALRSIHEPETLPARVTARLRRPLNLSAEQAARIESVLRARQQGLQRIWRQVQPDFDAELDRLDREVGQVLDDQQRSRWEQIFGHLRRTWVPAPPEPNGAPGKP